MNKTNSSRKNNKDKVKNYIALALLLPFVTPPQP